MLKYLLEKEFKQILRNPFLPRMIFVFPLAVLLLLPLAANFEIKNINLCVVDSDKSPYSRRLIRKVVSSGYFRLTDVAEDHQVALASVDLGAADLILEIPAHFERDLVASRGAQLMILADSVNGTKGGLGSSYLATIVADFGAEITGERVMASRFLAPSFSIIPRYRYNPHLRYPIFMVPALMVMLLTMICGFLPALNIVGEKEKGTIEQINVTPVRRTIFILSKLIPYWIIGFIVLSICFVVARVVYSLSPAGKLSTIYIFASAFTLAISGFGLVISNYAKTTQQAMFMMFFFVATFIFLSGLYTPLGSMPAWARIMSRFSPLRYFIRVMRLVYLKGSTVAELSDSFFALCAFAVFFNGWAVLSYHKKN